MNIYIGNLSFETTEDELREEFRKFGEVVSVTIMNDRYIGSGQTKGYGYIEMTSKEDAANAIANLEGKVLKDHVVNVIQALPLTKNGTAIPNSTGKTRSYRIREREPLTST